MSGQDLDLRVDGLVVHADVLAEEGVRQDDDGGGDAGGDPQVGQELLLVASGV